MASWKSAQAGAKTILLEREENPGRKVCAEGVLSDALPDAEVTPSNEFVANTISGAFLYAPDEKRRVNVGGEGYILDKPAFLHALAERARTAGAEIVYGRTVEDVTRKNGEVLITGKENGKQFSLKSS